jgi:uncharacterized protein
MQRFWKKISSDVALQIVAEEGALRHLSENEDAMVAPGNVILVVDLIEDELILAMPMIPRHEEGQCPETDCEPKAISSQEGRDVQEVPTTYRPFADLAKAIDKQKKLQSES